MRRQIDETTERLVGDLEKRYDGAKKSIERVRARAACVLL